MRIDNLLKKGYENGASDIHLKVGTSPFFRINGSMVKVEDEEILKEEDFEEFLENEVIDQFLVEKLRNERQVDIGYGLSGVGRFRVNIFYQRGTLAAVFRFIPFNIPSLEELHLPDVIKTLALKPRGLILVTGVTGSGKSTTLACIIDIINKEKQKNIITIEDPIEYLHKDINSSIIQRQVGYDVRTFAEGLRGALREDPDVIMVGELRDRETITTALEAVETGHLVMATMHTKDAVETVNRIIAAFPLNEQREIRLQLSATLEAVVSQRLLKRKDGKGMVPAVEIMIATELVREAILEAEKMQNIRRSIEINRDTLGTQTFDQSLLELYKSGLVSFEEAKENATNPNDFALIAKGIM